MNNLHPLINENGSLELTEIHMQILQKNAGKHAVVSMPKSTRSSSQNAFYWVYLHIIETETGNNAKDLHEFLKRKLLPPKFLRIKGKETYHEIKVPASTTELTKLEMGEYLERICALVHVPIPDPAEAGFFTE